MYVCCSDVCMYKIPVENIYICKTNVIFEG